MLHSSLQNGRPSRKMAHIGWAFEMDTLSVTDCHYSQRDQSSSRNSAMTAIREYPFDLSDLKDQPISTQPTSVETKRKVSIMADDPSKGYDNHAFERNRKVSGAEMGPARRKSNLHNSNNDSFHDRPPYEKPLPFEGRFKKHSSASSMNSKRRISENVDNLATSWWFSCCKKCHQDDNESLRSWEPPGWQKICPYPLCPSYRRFAQTISLFVIGILAWIVVYTILGDTAAPGGQLFTLAALAIAAHFGGWLMVKITTLPALIGMLIVGIVMQNVGLVEFDKDFQKVSSVLRKIALVIILTRAGLDLDPPAMRRMYLSVLKLGLVPWTAECCIIAVMTHYLLALPWMWAFLLGSIMAAVSPAVVVPCLFRLRSKGYGVAKGIPTLVLAVAGIDDAASVAIFGIVNGIMFSTTSLTYSIIQGPASIVAGILFGVFWGYLCKYVPERNDSFVVPLRVLMLLGGGLVAVLGSEHIGWDGSGPLAVVAAAFVACAHWSSMGWEVEDNPVATAFEIFWMLFEPILFGVTGAQVKIMELDTHLVLVGGGILMTGVVLRIFVTAGIGFKSNLNTKEKFFVGLSWMAKATVQAALGPVALDAVRNKGDASDEEFEYAETVVTMCILSIVLTAPLGAILISIAGPKLLTKTTKPVLLEGWRRSHRPSIRDISIIDEEDERNQPNHAELGESDIITNQNTTSNQNISSPLPPPTNVLNHT